VKNRFLSLDGKVKNENENVDKKNQKKILHDIHPFETTATDTDLIKSLFDSIKEIVLKKLLDAHGMA